MIKKVLSSFTFAFRGLKTAWREEYNFRIEVLATLSVIFSIFYFRFSFVESAFCILAMTIILSAEIMNTVVEDVCNKVEPHHDPMIGKIKDTASAFVLVSGLGAFALVCLVFWNHFFK